MGNFSELVGQMLAGVLIGAWEGCLQNAKGYFVLCYQFMLL